MNLAVAATTCALVIPVELPDKTFASCLVLSSRHRPLPVRSGVSKNPCGPPSRSERLLEAARAAKGFMPDEEGLALAALAEATAGAGSSCIVEVGAYCGRSTLYLAHGVLSALAAGTSSAAPVVFSVDHHHGSEENQAGWEHHDSALVDPETRRLDTLPHWRRAIEHAGVEGNVNVAPLLLARHCGMVGKTDVHVREIEDIDAGDLGLCGR